jgi:hypothetical protein
MLGVLAVLLLAVTPAPAAPGHCTLTALQACANTNQLVDDPQFAGALRRFFGDARGDYLQPNAPLADQVAEALHGPPEDRKGLATGDWLFTACRAHSCPEKGAVIVTQTGRILAAGLMNFNCRASVQGQAKCEKARRLDIFVRPGEADAARLIQPLDAWARMATEQERAQYGAQNAAPYAGPRVHIIRHKAG